jgi:sugar phosphate isomerase/epimerase
MSEHTLNRREVLTAAAAAGAVAGTGLSGEAAAQTKRVPGVQLYTVRDSMATDVEKTLQAIAGIGYREVEFAGYFGHNSSEVRAMLERFGLDSPSTHINAENVEDDPSAFVEHAGIVGHKYVTIAWIQPQNRQTIDDYKRWAAVANRLGEVCRANGMRAAYHNHDFEFQRLDGELPINVLLSETDADLLDIELDFFWVRKAGWEIRDALALAPQRMALSHIKDIDPADNMVNVGDGTIDFAGILADPVAAGIRHCFVEHDNPEDPFRSVAASHFAMKSILG